MAPALLLRLQTTTHHFSAGGTDVTRISYRLGLSMVLALFVRGVVLGQQPLTAQPQGTAQPPAPLPIAAKDPQNPMDADGAAALLDRIELVLNAELGNKPIERGAVGTAGVLPGVDSKSKAGKVYVDRAALDEILAEVQQLRTMLKVRQ